MRFRQTKLFGFLGDALLVAAFVGSYTLERLLRRFKHSPDNLHGAAKRDYVPDWAKPEGPK